MMRSELGTIILLGILILIVLATAVTKGGDPIGTACSRELWRVLFGGAASLFAVLLCLVQWNPSLLCWQSHIPPAANASASASNGSVAPPPASDANNSSAHMDRPSPLSSASTSAPSIKMDGLVHQFVTVLLHPHLHIACIVTAVYAAMTMQQRCGNGRIVKRICPMVVWIGIDADTYRKHSAAVTRVFRNRHLDEVPNLAIAVPWPGSALDYSKSGDRWMCSHGWEPRNRMWKEAMVVEGVLGDPENVEAWMGMVERGRPWWAAVLLVMQGVGYQVSIASRLAQGLEVSPVEMMSAWMSLFVVVEAGIMPLFAIPSKRGICLRLDATQFSKVAHYYHTHETEELNFINLWCFVFCILFILFMFLILIPPLVYYYRRLHHGSILSFASLILFTILAGAGIVAFALAMFLPPQEVHFTFTKDTSKYIFGIPLAIMLTGLASYVLAITETSMHWTRFQSADPSSFHFIIPHIGA